MLWRIEKPGKWLSKPLSAFFRPSPLRLVWIHAFEQWVVSRKCRDVCVQRPKDIIRYVNPRTQHATSLPAHRSKLKNLWSSVASALSACNYWVMSKLTANAKKTQKPTAMRWVLCFKRLDFATENALFGAFLGYFYRILQKYKILCRWMLAFYNYTFVILRFCVFVFLYFCVLQLYIINMT